MGFAIRKLDAATGPAPGDPMVVHSVLDGPIDRMSILRRSLLFAELSQVCYLSRAEAGMLANRIGLPEIRYYSNDGAQAYIYGNDDDAVVVCRGTEPHDWNDIRADLTLALTKGEIPGRVHRGFKREVDDLWPRLEQALLNNVRPVWFTGHSLGGAMATICAGRCKLSTIRSDPRSLYTFGSPRVGDHRYVHYVNIETYRWVNNNDIVSRVPPPWLGYRHKGQEVYLDSDGRVRRLTAWQRCKDRWRGFLRGLKNREIDHFTDHAITRYVDYILRAVEEEEASASILAFRRRQAAETLPRRRAA